MAGIWSRHIAVEKSEPSGSIAHIESTRDAAYFLLDHWKSDLSNTYRAAINMCTKAIKGEVSHEEAYVAFMGAVQEAKMIAVSSRHFIEEDNLEFQIATVLAESILSDIKGAMTLREPAATIGVRILE